jgi:hypothetical protein
MSRQTVCTVGAVNVIGITLFEDLQARQQRVWNFTHEELDELALMIRGQLAQHKDQLPLFSLVRFGKELSLNGSLRHDANVIAIGGFLGDYDGEVMSLEEAHEMLIAAAIPHLIYETPSSTPERPRWRILVWSSRAYEGSPAELKERIRQWRINGVLGGVLARESFNLSQAFYYGGLEDKQTIRFSGRPREHQSICGTI